MQFSNFLIVYVIIHSTIVSLSPNVCRIPSSSRWLLLPYGIYLLAKWFIHMQFAFSSSMWYSFAKTLAVCIFFSIAAKRLRTMNSLIHCRILINWQLITDSTKALSILRLSDELVPLWAKEEFTQRLRFKIIPLYKISSRRLLG